MGYRRQLKLLTLQNTSKVVVDLLCDHQEEFCHGTLDFFKGEKEAKLSVLKGNLITAVYESTISLQAACDFYKSQKDTTFTLFNKEKKELENLKGLYATSCPTFVSNKEASLSELERVIKTAAEQRVAVLNKNCEFWSECRGLPQDIYLQLENVFAKNMSLHDIFTSSDYQTWDNKKFLDEAYKNIAPTTFTAAGGLLSEEDQKKFVEEIFSKIEEENEQEKILKEQKTADDIPSSLVNKAQQKKKRLRSETDMDETQVDDQKKKFVEKQDIPIKVESTSPSSPSLVSTSVSKTVSSLPQTTSTHGLQGQRKIEGTTFHREALIAQRRKEEMRKKMRSMKSKQQQETEGNCIIM